MAQQNAVLFLWATSPLLPDALRVMAAWDFEYKANFIWDKVRHNYGHYNSVRHELLLLGTRGSCLPDANKLIDSVQSIERSDTHSEKPGQFRAIIDTLYPHGKHIELFARQTTPGWEAWGNECSTHN
jgi:N6-adenosine-specific RNA methylase IME4